METGRNSPIRPKYVHTHTHTHTHIYSLSVQTPPQLHTLHSGHTNTCIFTCNCFTVFQFVKKYGNVFSLDFGALSSVVITGLPFIKEAFVHQDKNFSNRPIVPIQQRVFKDKGKSQD